MVILKAYVKALKKASESNLMDASHTYLDPLKEAAQTMKAYAKKQRNYYQALVTPMTLSSFFKDITLPFAMLLNVIKVFWYAALGLTLGALSVLALVPTLLLFPWVALITAPFALAARIYSPEATIKWVTFIDTCFIKNIQRLAAGAFVAVMTGLYGALQSAFSALQQLVTFPFYLLGKVIYKILTLSSKISQSEFIQKFEKRINSEFMEYQKLIKEFPKTSGLANMKQGQLIEKLRQYQAKENDNGITTGINTVKIVPKSLVMNTFLQQLLDEYLFLNKNFTVAIHEKNTFDCEDPRSLVRLALHHYSQKKPNNIESRSNRALELLLNANTKQSRGNYLCSELSFDELIGKFEESNPEYMHNVNEFLNKLIHIKKNILDNNQDFYHMATHFLLVKTPVVNSMETVRQKLAILAEPDNKKILQEIATKLHSTLFLLSSKEKNFDSKAAYKASYWFYLKTLFNNPPNVCLMLLNHYLAIVKKTNSAIDYDNKFLNLCAMLGEGNIENNQTKNTIKAQFFMLMFFASDVKNNLIQNAKLFFDKAIDSGLLIDSEILKNNFGGYKKKYYQTYEDETSENRQKILSKALNMLLNEIKVPRETCFQFLNNLIAFYSAYKENLIKNMGFDDASEQLQGLPPKNFLFIFWDNLEALDTSMTNETYLGTFSTPYQCFFKKESNQGIYKDILESISEKSQYQKSAMKVVIEGKQSEPLETQNSSSAFFNKATAATTENEKKDLSSTNRKS